MHDQTQGHLGGLQVDTPRLAALVLNQAYNVAYFARDFLEDRVESFFPWADCGGSSIGRIPQIRSLTSSSWLPSSRKRWYSATSRCALANAAGVEKVSVTVFLLTLRVSRK